MNKDITNHQSALDINEIWAAIEPQVDKINAQRKKRKPVFLYWLSGIVLFVGLVGASFFLFSENNGTQNENLPKETTQTVAPIVAKEQTATIENQEAIISKTTEIEKSPAVSTVPPSAIVANKNSVVANKPIVEKSPEVILPATNNTRFTTAPITENKISISNNEIISNFQDPISTKIVNHTNQSSIILPVEKSVTSLAQLPISTIGLEYPTTELPELNFSIKNNKRQLPLYVERPTFSIEFQTGISATNRTLNSTGLGNLDSIATLRNTFEKSLETLHANLLVNAHFPSGFFVSSGVAFTQISELYQNNSTQSEIVIDPMGIQKRIINVTGDTIDVIGPVETTVTTTFTKEYYNTYRMIDIPVFVGYQYDFGDWKTDFSLGVFANILLATEGRIPNSPLTDLDLGTNGKDIYRSRVDFSLQFGLGVSKSLTDKLSVRVNPMFRYYSKNFMKENYGLSQRYLLFGGTIGLRMDL